MCVCVCVCTERTLHLLELIAVLLFEPQPHRHEHTRNVLLLVHFPHLVLRLQSVPPKKQKYKRRETTLSIKAFKG